MGIIICVAAMVIGCFIGVGIKGVFQEGLKDSLLDLFGVGAIVIGIVNVIKVERLTYVLLSIILGGLIGEVMNIESKANVIVKKCIEKANFKSSISYTDLFMTAIVIFCASGSGIFGAILEGVNGDSQVLISKGILDFFTAMIMATSLGKYLAWISIPECMILSLFYFLGQLLMPYLNLMVIQDFMAVGGVVTMLAGINIIGIKKISVLNITPSMILVLLLGMVF